MTRRRHVIGITGNIATGKTTVVEMLVELGADAIDADKLVHQMMGPGSELAGPLSDEFGPEVVSDDGSINRPALGQIVFSDPGKLGRLEELIHPHVVRHMVSAIEEPGADVLVLDAIKLYEAGIADHCDEIWVVDADIETRIRRVVVRNEVDRAEALRRINAQPPQEEKIARADRVIDNGGPLEETRRQVLDAWKDLTSR
ncbi:MAG: dephospho-CoA kinase [Thermomicrobiales bacterium]